LRTNKDEIINLEVNLIKKNRRIDKFEDLNKFLISLINEILGLMKK